MSALKKINILSTDDQENDASLDFIFKKKMNLMSVKLGCLVVFGVVSVLLVEELNFLFDH